MGIIKAVIKEKFIYSDKDAPRQGLYELDHDVRFFSSEEKYQEWYDSFRKDLWEDLPGTKDLREGVYVEKFYIPIDDITPPSRLQKYATFRKGISGYYDAD